MINCDAFEGDTMELAIDDDDPIQIKSVARRFRWIFPRITSRFAVRRASDGGVGTNTPSEIRIKIPWTARCAGIVLFVKYHDRYQ